MAKILLVEDDNNLREIYEARLQAEGYDIVSAKDGEEALVVAKKERPDLIIADVMMPRVSGFEMLDILRNTPELKDVHVIMLTALGQAEDKTRADSLGADRYLVKSQVTLEDIVKASTDVLSGAPAATAAMTAAAADGTQTQTMPTVMPVAPAPAEPVTSAPVSPSPTPDVAAVPVSTGPPQDLSTPQVATPTPLPVSLPIAAAPPDDTTQPAPQEPAPTPPQNAPTPPPVQDVTAPTSSAPASTPEPSTTDSQLMADAVNNLAAGTAPQDSTAPVVPPQDLIAPAQATPVASPPPLTMQPVVTAPVVPPTPAQPTPAASETTPSARKAILPPVPGSFAAQPNLNDLMAKEGHSLDDNNAPQTFSGFHMPGNVITPGAAGQNPPGNPTPTDPNSISL